jgi:hypothetical protein
MSRLLVSNDHRNKEVKVLTFVLFNLLAILLSIYYEFTLYQCKKKLFLHYVHYYALADSFSFP